MELGPPDDWQPHGQDTSNPYGGQGSFDVAHHFDAMSAPDFLPTDTSHTAEVDSPAYAQPPDQWRRPDTLPDSPDGVYEGFPTGNAYVGQAPTMQAILNGPERDTPITYWHSTIPSRQFRYIPVPDDAEQRVTTETEALRELDEFLLAAPERLAATGHPEAPRYTYLAELVRHNLFFIGSHEFNEATAGIAGLWRTYMADNPTHQIFVPVGSIRVSNYERKKSDARVFEGVMSHLDPNEKRRIVTRAKDIRDLQKTRTELLDDWSKSGAQAEAGHRSTIAMLERRHALSWRGITGGAAAFAQPVMNLLVASDRQLEQFALNDTPVPLRAYYHGGTDAATGRKIDLLYTRFSGPLVTGLHSSVDIGFEDRIAGMAEIINEHSANDPVHIPALANLIRR